MTEKTQGHGYFRKKKWAKGLVSGIAVAGIVAFSAGSAFADETVQPESKTTITFMLHKLVKQQEASL